MSETAGDMEAEPVTAFLEGAGETAELILAYDWGATSLGPVGQWPQSLKTAVGMIVHSPVPIVMQWGEDGFMIYNDAYSVFASGNHPKLLGSKVREGWAEVADFNDNVMKVCLAGGTLQYKDQELTLYRNGVAEQVWMNLDYSPVIDESGRPAGVIAIVVETTERVQAERRSAAEHDRLSQIFQQAPTYMAMLTGPDLRVELANPGFQLLVGNRDLIGRPLAEAVPDVVTQRHVALLEQVFRSGVAYRADSLRYALVPESGGPASDRFFDFVYQPIHDGDGRTTGIFIEGIDVTERVKSDAALCDSEARFRGVTEAMPGFVWTADASGALDYTSSRWLEYSGDPGDGGLGGGWAAFVHPEDRSLALMLWAGSVAGGAVYEMEFRLRRRDGAYRWWLVRAVPTRDKSGAIVRWIGSAADIDALVKAREMIAQSNDLLEEQVALRTAELENREAQLRAIFATSHLYQGLLDMDGRLLDANAASLEGIAAPREAVVGKFYWECPWFTDTPGMPEVVRASVVRAAAGAAESVPIAINLPTGRRSFDFSMRPVFGSDGAVVAILPEAVETTARLHAEQALRQSQKLEAMGQLTGGVAHDFNNLLTPIIGSLDILSRRAAGSERDFRLIDGALQAAERARILVQRLLAFARRQPLQSTAVDLKELIEGMADLIASTTGPNIEVVVALSNPLPAGHADPNQLEMAILNLSVNARDAMPNGGQLTIAAAAETIAEGHRSKLDAGEYVRLTVADTGIGMSPATTAQAIEPFFSTKGIGQGGTGLGLSMVHGLALQLGGALLIESQPGRGSTIDILLPVSKVQHAVRHVAATVPERPQAVGVALLVDDEVLARMSTAAMLADLGFDVMEATSAEEALRIADRSTVIDILITDHLMPGMSGANLAQKWREVRPGVPALLVSGYAEADCIAPDLPLLGKPFRQADLTASIRALMPLLAGDAIVRAQKGRLT